jgi:hypothetical protein
MFLVLKKEKNLAVRGGGGSSKEHVGRGILENLSPPS